LLDARVSRQESGLLQRGTVVDIQLAQGSGDRQPQRAGLAGDPATAQVRDHVEGVDPLGHAQRLTYQLLVNLVGEVRLEAAAVEGERAGTGDDPDADDGLLAAAHRLDRAVGAGHAAGSLRCRRGRRRDLYRDFYRVGVVVRVGVNTLGHFSVLRLRLLRDPLYLGTDRLPRGVRVLRAR